MSLHFACGGGAGQPRTKSVGRTPAHAIWHVQNHSRQARAASVSTTAPSAKPVAREFQQPWATRRPSQEKADQSPTLASPSATQALAEGTALGARQHRRSEHRRCACGEPAPQLVHKPKLENAHFLRRSIRLTSTGTQVLTYSTAVVSILFSTTTSIEYRYKYSHRGPAGLRPSSSVEKVLDSMIRTKCMY